ncbi:glycosyltransferase family 4 protein [Halomonas sp. TBZ9]|uniref:Glycosyltransferase family 4 protein n=1 Tax=Vreelandella azerica TaxID=2732867 RepID=A0A7Y3XAF4_9GAMM|nr:glycosyltransferase [Halomonas azerica]NOG32712.1 glycosyltransferase family 4 protein [Halomonas azerica]
MKQLLLWTNLYPTKKAPHYGTFVKSTEQAWRQALGNENVQLVAIREKPTGKFSKIRLYVGLLTRCARSLRNKPAGTLLEVHYPVYFLPLLYLLSLVKPKHFYLVLRFHGTDLVQITSSRLFRSCFHRLKYNIDLCVAPSEHFRHQISTHLDFSLSRIVKVYPDSVGEHFVAQSNASSVTQSNMFTVGCVSRLEPGKNCQSLLEAFAKLAIPNKRLILVGEGSQRTALERAAEQLGIASSTTFTGALPREQLPTVLTDFSVFVFPSVSESFGLVAVEALACGIPVIANAKLHASKEYIQEGKNGFFYEDGVEGLVAAIEAFYAQPEDIRAFLSEQASKVRQQFSDQQVFSQGVNTILRKQQSD